VAVDIQPCQAGDFETILAQRESPGFTLASSLWQESAYELDTRRKLVKDPSHIYRVSVDQFLDSRRTTKDGRCLLSGSVCAGI
jgi:hypothetical protein